jgi:Flp pilus assembly protein TadD
MAYPVFASLVRPAAFWRRLALAGLLALPSAGCLTRAKSNIAGAGGGAAPTEEEWRRSAQAWGPRFEANPADAQAAIYYARALRATEQRAQAVAVLQQAAIRNPNHLELLAAYGKALGDVGRYKEANEVLGRAHTPERPDWRILSAQGAIADQVGDHVSAQRYYDSALKIAPGEPSVLSNLGLSYALSKRLPEAEEALRQAANHPAADMRVRQNFALVLGLQGRFQDAEEVFRRDLPASEVAANMTALRRMIAQPNSLAAIRGVSAAAQSPASRGKTEPVKTAAQKAPLPKPPAQKAADQKAAVQTADGQKTPAQGSRLELRRF